MFFQEEINVSAKQSSEGKSFQSLREDGKTMRQLLKARIQSVIIIFCLGYVCFQTLIWVKMFFDIIQSLTGLQLAPAFYCLLDCFGICSRTLAAPLFWTRTDLCLLLGPLVRLFALVKTKFHIYVYIIVSFCCIFRIQEVATAHMHLFKLALWMNVQNYFFGLVRPIWPPTA